MLKISRELECSYVETSSADGHNCVLPFKTAVKLYNYTYSDAHSDFYDSSEHKITKTSLVKKCKNFLGVNQSNKREASPVRLGSRTPESITITISMEK